ncbi:MAG: hypothetical protein R2697_03290 [Ilumatobacteraceae bacterium]
MTDRALTAETVELLQTMIRNACVNDGSRVGRGDSGTPTRSSTSSRVPGSTCSTEAVEGAPVVARIEGLIPMRRRSASWDTPMWSP